MQCLVTGAGGFIGSHLVEALAIEGHQVHALVQYNGRDAKGWESVYDHRGNVRVIRGDVRDPRLVGQVRPIPDRFDAIFHLAALGSVPYSVAAPHQFIETNIGGTQNVIEVAKRYGGKLVLASTSEVYGTPETTPITERHCLTAQSPYAASKIAAEKLVEAAVFSKDIEATILRMFNTYGPRQSQRAIIPQVIMQALSSERIRVGTLTTKRDFVYVEDTVWALMQAARPAFDLGPYNFGTGEAHSVSDIIEYVSNLRGVELVPELSRERERKAYEVETLIADRSKFDDVVMAAHGSGYNPGQLTLNIIDGLLATLTWLETNNADYRGYVI